MVMDPLLQSLHCTVGPLGQMLCCVAICASIWHSAGRGPESKKVKSTRRIDIYPYKGELLAFSRGRGPLYLTCHKVAT